MTQPKRTFSLRIDDADLATIEAAAKAVGMTTGAFMVQQALGQAVGLERAYEDRMTNVEAHLAAVVRQLDEHTRRLAELESRWSR